MSVNLAKLPADEEVVRKRYTSEYVFGKSTQNVLAALNFYRCRAKFAEQELERANAELIEVRNSSEHNRIFGGSYGRV
jgi:hypothetical protein